MEVNNISGDAIRSGDAELDASIQMLVGLARSRALSRLPRVILVQVVFEVANELDVNDGAIRKRAVELLEGEAA